MMIRWWVVCFLHLINVFVFIINDVTSHPLSPYSKGVQGGGDGALTTPPTIDVNQAQGSINDG